MTIDIRADDPRSPAIAPLLALHLGELRGVMTPEFAFALDADELAAPGIAFFSAWREGVLVGMAALKRLDDDAGEVKSMRATPPARGTGVGRALIRHVVAAARAAGHRRLHLETGTADTHAAAVGLYHSEGFVDGDAFADYAPSPHNRFMVLHL
jgi:putative acetyltransferase